MFAVKARFTVTGSRVPRVLWAIIQDTIVHFLFTFTSHPVLETTLLFTRVSAPPVAWGSPRLKISIAKPATFAGQV